MAIRKNEPGLRNTEPLTERQTRVLEVIRRSIDERGYPPSMREIAEQVELASASSVQHQLNALQRKGYIRRDPNRPRALEILDAQDTQTKTEIRQIYKAMVKDLHPDMNGGKRDDEARLADAVVLMDAGRVLRRGSPEEVLG